MSESDFNERVDDTLFAIEEAIDQAQVDIDYDTVAGILTLEFSDQSKIIINRQSALSQLWVAARSGGFHLDYKDDHWFCKTENCTLQTLIDRVCTEQSQVEVHLALSAD